MPNQNVSVFSGTSDAPQLAYYETVQVAVMNRDPGAEAIQFELYAGFCETLEHVGLGLLGQNGFFSRFQLAFNYGASYFEID